MDHRLPDAYANWLAIPAHHRPPTYYQLLGIDPSELDPKAIAAAADRQLERLRPHETGSTADESRRLQREVVQARDTLIDPVARQRYDTLTPDAADPWWKPEGEKSPSDGPEPVEGWWQGESPDAERPTPSSAPPATHLTTVPALPTGPDRNPGTDNLPPSPGPARSDDLWKATPDELAASERVAVPPPPLPEPRRADPPTPTPIPVEKPPPAAPAPVIREKALTFGPAQEPRSPWPLLLLGLFGIGVVGAAVLFVTRPWGTKETPPDNQQVAEHKTKPESVATVVTPGKPSEPMVPASGTRTPDPTIKVTGPIEPKGPPQSDPVPMKDPSPPDPGVFAEPVTFRGHTGGALGVAVSRSAKMIFSVGDDRNIVQYAPDDKGKHRQVHRLQSPGLAVTLCNDDRDVVFCDGGEVVVYDLASRKVRASFENPRGGIRSLAAAPDGSFVLTGTTDGCVRKWSTAKKGLADTLDLDDKATVTAVAVGKDGLAGSFGLSDGRICAWDLKGRREVKRWKAHTGSVTALAYAPDGQQVVSGGDDGQIGRAHV